MLSHLRNRRGQGLVELALVLPLFALIMLGASDLGRAFYFSVAAENAAREGARHGAYYDPTTSSDPYDTQAAIFTAVNSEANFVTLTQLTPPPLGGPCPSPPYAGNWPSTANSGNVIVCFNGNWTATPAAVGQNITVILLYNYAPLTPMLGSFIGSGTLHIAGTSTFVVQGLT